MSTLNVDTLADELGTGGPDFVGMPSVGGDPVVESGSNTDGEWVRWADGAQQCRYFEAARPVTAIPRTEGSISFYYAEHAWTFPAAFISTPFIELNGRPNTSGGGIQIFKPTALSSVFSTSADLRLCTPSDIVEVEYYSVLSSGRWK